MALEMGLPIDKANSREFLDEMRFLEMKRWLIEVLNPQRPKSTKVKTNTEVIGGVPVVIEEFSKLVD